MTTQTLSHQLTLVFLPEWEAQLGDRADAFKESANLLLGCFADSARLAFDAGRHVHRMLEIAGETLLKRFLSANHIRPRAYLRFDLYLLIKDCADQLTDDQWLGLDELLSHARIARERFRDGVRAVLEADDPRSEADRIVSSWTLGAGGPHEDDVKDKALEILKSAGFQCWQEQRLDNNTRTDIVADADGLSLIVECKKELNIGALTKALGQLRAYHYELPDHLQCAVL